MGQPHDQKTSALLAHTYGRTSRLPPAEGAEVLSYEEVRKQDIDLFRINAIDKSNSPLGIRSRLKESIANSVKYITPIEYDGTTLYSDVIAYFDMMFAIVAEIRDEYALENYGVTYEGIGKEQQEKVRKRYPLTVVMKNIDENPDDFGIKR